MPQPTPVGNSNRSPSIFKAIRQGQPRCSRDLQQRHIFTSPRRPRHFQALSQHLNRTRGQYLSSILNRTQTKGCLCLALDATTRYMLVKIPRPALCPYRMSGRNHGSRGGSYWVSWCWSVDVNSSLGPSPSSITLWSAGPCDCVASIPASPCLGPSERKQDCSRLAQRRRSPSSIALICSARNFEK